VRLCLARKSMQSRYISRSSKGYVLRSELACAGDTSTRRLPCHFKGPKADLAPTKARYLALRDLGGTSLVRCLPLGTQRIRSSPWDYCGFAPNRDVGTRLSLLPFKTTTR